MNGRLNTSLPHTHTPLSLTHLHNPPLIHNPPPPPRLGGALPKMEKMDEHSHLNERTNFKNPKLNERARLTRLDQCILLSFCLDVQNTNPASGLTTVQMSPYLERVLLHHSSWTIYSAALLTRAKLECEAGSRRERAILQMQALADQHTSRLTITQSTYKAAVEDSAPPQNRLVDSHATPSPPRWAVLADLAARYAKMGVVATAAEMFESVHMWDEVVECLRHAGKKNDAIAIVKKR